MDEQREKLAARPWVILGCGYTGTRLAIRLRAAGARVVATCRNRAALGDVMARAPGIEPRVVDVAAPDAFRDLIPPRSIVVYSVPPLPGKAPEARCATAAAGAGARRLVYIGSTGVYPDTGGAWVDESVEPAPIDARGAARLAAEQSLLGAAARAGLEAVSLRAVGIYGPGRGVIERMRAGTYRIVGEQDTFTNRIHVHDLVSAVIAAGTVEPLEGHICNVADDEPAPSSVYAAAVAERLGVPLPPRVPLSQVSPQVAAMLGANRRISNRHMRAELGVILRYPSWRDSLDELITARR